MNAYKRALSSLVGEGGIGLKEFMETFASDFL